MPAKLSPRVVSGWPGVVAYTLPRAARIEGCLGSAVTDVEDSFLRSPLHRFLGLTFASPEPGVAEVHLPFREELISDPDVPYLHGGILTTRLGTRPKTLQSTVDQPAAFRGANYCTKFGRLRLGLETGLSAEPLDVAGDYAVATRVGHGVPTIDVRVDFLRTAGRERLTAHARVLKLGGSISVTDAEVRARQGEIVAIGRIAYSTRSV
jgi:uncharacterized protein (TIGR00369 family)